MTENLTRVFSLTERGEPYEAVPWFNLVELTGTLKLIVHIKCFMPQCYVSGSTQKVLI